MPARRKRGKKTKNDDGLLTVFVSNIDPRWMETAMSWCRDKGYGKGRASAIRAVLRDWVEARTQGEQT